MIFCVEDDSNIRELVVYTLNTTGMEARKTNKNGFLNAFTVWTRVILRKQEERDLGFLL